MRFYSLDAMRGIAAITVVYFHINLQISADYVPYAYLAVDFFFMLSGFVLANAYEAQLRNHLGAATFFKMRAIRLYPMFALGALLGIITLIAQNWTHSGHAMGLPQSVTTAALNLIALPSPANKLLFPINPPAWSLFFEFLINIAFAFVLFRLTTGALRAVVLGIAILFAVIIFEYGDAGVGPGWVSALAGLARVSYTFTLGMLFARMHGEKRATPSILIVLAAAALAGLLLVPIESAVTLPFNLLTVFLLLPGILWAGILFDLPRRLRPMGKMLGDISYPLYAVHFPLLQMATYGIRRFDLPVLPSMAAFAVAAIVGAWLLSIYVDPPLRKWLACRIPVRPQKI